MSKTAKLIKAGEFEAIVYSQAGENQLHIPGLKENGLLKRICPAKGKLLKKVI